MQDTHLDAVAAPNAAGLAELHTAAERLWLDAQQWCPALSIEVLPEVGSTNAHALQLARQGCTSPTVVVAWHQNAGRGRAGRVWAAQPGQSLTMSLGLPLDLGFARGDASALSLAMAVVVVQALNAWRHQGAPHQAPAQTASLHAAARLGIKWPNDLWVQDRKLGGILIETSHSPLLPEQQRWVVVGLGLNLWGTPTAWQAERCDLAQWLGANASSASRADARAHADTAASPPQPGALMQVLVPALVQGARLFEQAGFGAFQEHYMQMDVLAGRAVGLWRHGVPATASTTEQAASLAHPNSPDAQGHAVGVDAQGALLIHDDSGQTRPWSLGEVSVRPQPDPL